MNVSNLHNNKNHTDLENLLAGKNAMVFRQIIPKDVIDKCRLFLEENVSKELENIGIKSNIKLESNSIRDQLQELSKDKNLSDDVAKVLTGHFSLDVRLNEIISSVAKQSGLIDSIISYANWDKDISLHMPPMVRFVIPGNTNAAVPVHQDILYNKHLKDFVTAWIPLVSIDENCGGIKMFGDPGELTEEAEISDNNVWFKPIDAGSNSGIDCIPMSPGDVLIFSKTCIHSSMPNLSNKIRYSLDLRIFPTRLGSEKHYLRLNTGELYEPR